ncbi:hypothetical protein ACFZAE_19995 [Streptomyces scabiei]|uniref:hypothetical protein n=1 Tax=Streptomyces TaxID=1883 RepID=UPI001BFF166D|nr:hypothetical protein [Streptomyces sp. ATCC 21386]
MALLGPERQALRLAPGLDDVPPGRVLRGIAAARGPGPQDRTGRRIRRSWATSPREEQGSQAALRDFLDDVIAVWSDAPALQHLHPLGEFTFGLGCRGLPAPTPCAMPALPC